MAETKRLLKVACGTVAALSAALVWGPGGDAEAARQRRGRGVLAVETSSVNQRSDVALNEVVEIAFTSNVLAASVGPATVQIRALNDSRTGYTKQIFGTYQVFANVIRFFPRLPGHLRDSSGNFYVEGSAKDDASLNAGFQPSTDYQLAIIGRPEATTVRSTTRRPLRRSTFHTFSTSSSTDPSDLFTTRTYSDSPPPEFAFSNPTDTVPSAATQYATRGGTKGVPNEISVQIYCTRVPLAPGSTRVSGNVTLTMLERYGNPELRRPVRGTPYVEQNFESTLLVFKPKFPLSDRAEYALRISKNVKDLTEEYDFAPNRDRERLRALYDFLSSSRASHPPGTPASLLDDPPLSLAGDWPPLEQTELRGTLKANILALGDTYPEEFDPRVMLIFTTRDEPVTNAEFRIDFLKSDGLYDGQLSSGEWDQSVPDAASAVFTAAAGSVTDGDFAPSANVTLPSTALPGPVYNFRNVAIPPGVTVTLKGNQPITIRALTFTLGGTLDASGANGNRGVAWRGTGGSTEYALGGAGGPGGGDGGDSVNPGTLSDWWYGGGSAGNPGNNGPYRGGTGEAGADTEGADPTLIGGQGGQGGSAATGSASGYTYSYCYGGGGGGGGAAERGKDGKNASWTGTPYSAWNGVGGQGGAVAKVVDLQPFFGGSGGGCSGCGGFNPDYSSSVNANGWTSGGASGGGGGGAVAIQTAKVLTIGSTGVIRAAGGAGGAYFNSSYGETGGGGGGSGGSILLRSTGGFSIAAPSLSLQVSGGPGASGGSYSGAGGAGSIGFLRAEDPNGAAGLPLPGLSGSPRYASLGVFDPLGGGVPSYVYSKWADLGVEDPRILPWTNDDIATDPNVDDAIYVMVQMTKEDPINFGMADTSKIDSSQDSTDLTVTSQWLPIKVHDRTGLPGSGAFPVPGYSPGSDGQEFSGFPVDDLNGHGYRFIRFRIFFQLDSEQRFSDDLPKVDFLVTNYQYNL